MMEDEELGINIVTDVRLKRTIRDYLHDFKKQEILVREIEYEVGKIQDAKLRAEDFLKKDGNKIDKKEVKTLAEMKNLILENILKECIDVRLFGGTIPIEKSTDEKSAITLTGPVQFRMGRSLHKVEVIHIKGTGAFASQAGKEQKTFRDEYVLPYSLICFYGIINENASKYSHLTEEDVDLLLEGIWNGTKNLISRSKIGQMPRLLLRVIYKEDNYHIGDLDKKIHVKYAEGMSDEKVRSINDFKIDITELWESIDENRNRILKLEFQLSPDLNFVSNGQSMTSSSFKEALEKNFKATDLHLQ
jgi:CRISPR-associated protein Csh2